MLKQEFIDRMDGKPWKNRGCTFDAADCWGLIVLYYRHVLGVNIHHTDDYESDREFLTCYHGEIVFWRQATAPSDGCMFVAYEDQHPKHVGLVLDGHTITYNLSTQSVDYTLRPSRSFADAVIHTWLVMGKQSESSIDIFELYSIAASLPDVRLGYFDYTFDDEDISLGSRVQTICDAATVTAFWDDGVLSFTRDEKKSNPVTVFNRANMTTEGYSLSYDMTLPGGFDGVEVEYRNPTTNKQDYIRYKISGSAILEGEPVKAKKFEMLYVRDAYQARDRAMKEVRRLLYSRITAAITAMADGEWINVGQMIQIADIYDENQQDGYIMERLGDVFTTSERIAFTGDMFVVVTDSNGTPTARVRADQRADTAFGFIAVVPNVSLNIWDGIDVQSPSRYIIATAVEQDATKWTVTEKKPNSSGTTSITAVEYSDEMFNYLIA